MEDFERIGSTIDYWAVVWSINLEETIEDSMMNELEAVVWLGAVSQCGVLQQNIKALSFISEVKGLSIVRLLEAASVLLCSVLLLLLFLLLSYFLALFLFLWGLFLCCCSFSCCCCCCGFCCDLCFFLLSWFGIFGFAVVNDF